MEALWWRCGGAERGRARWCCRGRLRRAKEADKQEDTGKDWGRSRATGAMADQREREREREREGERERERKRERERA